MFPKSAILTAEEKLLIRQSLFLYQKNCYVKIGDLSPTQREVMKNVIDKLHLS